CRELHLPELVCRLLVARGHRDIEDAKSYLRPRLEHLSDPSMLRDLDRAAERIVRAVRNRETILIHGDYDVDGICWTTILNRYLTWLGGAGLPFIPHRRDGYDLTAAGVAAAKAAGGPVLITSDLGTGALAGVAA